MDGSATRARERARSKSLTRQTTRDGKLRDHTKSGDGLEVAIPFKDEVELLLRGADAEIVQGDVTLGEGVLARLDGLLLGLGDNLGIGRVGVRDLARRGGRIGLVGEVFNNLRASGEFSTLNLAPCKLAPRLTELSDSAVELGLVALSSKRVTISHLAVRSSGLTFWLTGKA